MRAAGWIRLVPALVAFSAVLAPAQRPAAAGQAWSVSGELALASDERERGLSLTGKDMGGGAAVYLDHRSGWFLGLRARRAELPDGADAEITGVLGRTGSIGAYDWAVNLTLNAFVGGGPTFLEAAGEVSRDFGVLLAYARLALAPDGRWVERDGFVGDAVLGIEAPVPRLPALALFAQVGGEWPARTHARGHWQFGARLAVGPLRLSVSYVDSTSALAIAKAGVLARLSLPF